MLRYSSALVGATVFLVLTSCLPSEYFGLDIAGLTFSPERIWLVVLMGQFAFSQYFRLGSRLEVTWADGMLLAFLGWLLVRTFSQPLAPQIPGQPSTAMHLINGYLVPLVLYLTIRYSPFEPRHLTPSIVILLIFGVYLSVTAVLEIAKAWSLVFPKIIADPTIGIHFGRARGPMLQSVRLGICLNLCLATLWLFPIWLNRHRQWAWMLAIVLTPLLLGGIFLTYTRSIWMGTAAIVIILVAALLRGRWRKVALGSMLFGGTVAGLLVGPYLVAFKREYTEAETRESTYMRAAFAYVSGKMFVDRPLTGFGFNQFQVHNRAYLSDRTTDIRLESIRGYVHHNSYLSILVDLGLIGGILYGMGFLAMFRPSLRLWRRLDAPDWARSMAALAFCVMAVHAIQMAFHEVSFSPIENSVLMLVLGCVIVCHEKFCGHVARQARDRRCSIPMARLAESR
jgi:O-antigen ligase